MKLRKLKYGCGHVDETHPYGRFEPHANWVPYQSANDMSACPGGVFLPDDTLIVEDIDEVRKQLTGVLHRELIYPHPRLIDAILDALSVREAE